jgi:hypothetical protein
MLSETQEFNNNKVWDIISRNFNQNQLSTKHDIRIKTVKTINKKNKSHPTIHRKIIPLFIDEEIKVYQRDEIIHKFDIFENERKKKYTSKKMNNLFDHLFYNKNNKKKKLNKFHLFNSPTINKNLITNNNFENKNQNDLLHINLSGSNKNYFQYQKKLFNKTSNISKEETDDNFDTIDSGEKVIKGLEDKYFFFNKNKIDKRKIQINRIFKNPKYMKIKYFHEIDRIKRAHFMDLTPESIFSNYKNYKINNLKGKSFSSNNTNINKKNTNFFNSTIKLNYTTSNNNIKNNDMNKTMNKLNFNSSLNRNLNNVKLMNSTTGFNFIKNNNDVFKKNNPDLNLYIKNIINGIN